MLDRLASTCDRCDEPLAEMMLEFATDAGVRRAYECDCGAVTITVVGGARTDR